MVSIFTKIIDKDDEEGLIEAGKIIKGGGLVAFPTETVYGLGANAFSSDAAKKIYKAKGRPSDNPLIVHVDSVSKISEIVREISKSAQILIDNFMPGPITLIMKKSDKIPDEVTAGLDTVAVRFPSDKTAQKLIHYSCVPIAAPSANLSGKPSPTIARHVISDMQSRIECIIDGGACLAGVESTIVDCSSEIPVILRPGIISYEDLSILIPDILLDKHILKSIDSNEVPKCPGMKYKHYAPDAEVFVIEGEKDKVKNKIDELIAMNLDKKIGVFSCTDNSYSTNYILRVKNNKEYAHSLFTYLRQFDEMKVDIVYAEFCIFDKYALAVKNRLYKSAASRVTYL